MPGAGTHNPQGPLSLPDAPPPLRTLFLTLLSQGRWRSQPTLTCARYALYKKTSLSTSLSGLEGCGNRGRSQHMGPCARQALRGPESPCWSPSLGSQLPVTLDSRREASAEGIQHSGHLTLSHPNIPPEKRRYCHPFIQGERPDTTTSATTAPATGRGGG